MIEDADIFIYQCHRSIIENNVSLALSGNSNTIDQQLSDATYVALEPKKQLKIVTLHRLKAFRFLRLIILIWNDQHPLSNNTKSVSDKEQA